MKKLLGVLLLVVACTSVQADLLQRNWSSQAVYTDWNVQRWQPFVYGDGHGWDVGVVPAGSSESTLPDNPLPEGLSWYTGYGYGIRKFDFDAIEGESVVMRFYNGNIGVDATHYAESIPLALPDIEGTPGSGDLDVRFTYAPNTQWQPIPEPSSIAMIGLGAGVLYHVRARRRLDYKE